MLRVYWVTTPEYQAVEDYIDHYTLYCTAQDQELVEANSKREAVSIAVNKWLKEKNSWRYRNYCQGRKDDGICPWTGIRAEIAKCHHDVEMPLGFEDDFWCDECQKEYDQETAEWLEEMANEKI